MKIAFVTGITGQDGSYLAELLLEKGYMVHGLIRRCSSINTMRIDHIFHNSNLFLHYGDLTDSSCLNSILSSIKSKYLDIEAFKILFKQQKYRLYGNMHLFFRLIAKTCHKK